MGWAGGSRWLRSVSSFVALNADWKGGWVDGANSNPLNPMIGTPSNRFRSSGLVAATVACVAGATAVLTANAAIVFTDNANLTVDTSSGPGDSHNIFPAATSDGIQLYGGFDGKSGTDTASLLYINSTRFVDVSATPNVLDKLSSGVAIGSSSSFNGSSLIAGFGEGLWNRGDDAYVGFKFNPSGSLVLYGWGHLVRSSTGTDTVTLTQYAYDNTGAAILTGATGLTPVPEPADFAFAGGVGLLALAGGRRLYSRFCGASGRKSA